MKSRIFTKTESAQILDTIWPILLLFITRLQPFQKHTFHKKQKESVLLFSSITFFSSLFQFLCTGQIMIIFHEVAAFHYCQGQSQGALKITKLHQNNKLNAVYCPASLPEFSTMLLSETGRREPWEGGCVRLIQAKKSVLV